MINTDLSGLNGGASVDYSTDPILQFIYDTPAEATAKAKEWGFDGYRVYIINGAVKYVPCTTNEEYIQATRLYMVQGAIVAQGKEVFGDKLVGYQFTEKDTVKGDPIYTLGNFTITTNVTDTQQTVFTLADPWYGLTAADFTQDGIEALKAQVTQNVTATVRFDKSNLEKYVTYQSLSERFRVCLQEILETFPAALHIVPYSIEYPAIFDYYSYPNGTAATFKVAINDIDNPFTIDYFSTGLTAVAPQYITPLRNFTKNYAQYEVYYNGTSYPIVGFTAPRNRSDANGLWITVQGDPFVDVISVNRSANVNFYIKPTQKAFNSYYDTASDLAAYLLNPKSNPLYVATFNVPHRMEDDTFQIIPKDMTFPMYDAFNVDVFGDKFDVYTNDLYFIADEFDRYKTDLIARFLTSESLQEYDTENRKTYATLEMYGSMFDNVKKYADGIAYMTNVSYDRIDNVPDTLLKNFARTLGWKTYELESDETLLEALFDVSKDRQGDDTPAEIDIELWRRIIINSFYLFKSKGTRKSLEFMLELVGIPLEIMDINEYVYVAEHPLDYSYYYSLFNTNIVNYPVDTDGYPTTPPNLYFQAYGGSLLSNAQNVGPYDGGKAYMDTFRKFSSYKAFDLHRTIDNKKSWVKVSEETNQSYDLLLRNTNYTISDSRLIINSKEADAAISSQMTMDYYVYSFYNKNEYTISVSGATVEPAKLTFNDYIREITSKLIDPKNRKVVKVYPVLSKIYWDYLDYAGQLNKKTIDYTKTLSFIREFDSYWVKLLQQFVPATTIFIAGKKYANANITTTKFQYKHGLNTDKSWMGTDGSEFQDDALKPSPVGELDIFQPSGYLGADLHGNDIVWHINCELSLPALSYLTRGGYYEAYNYNFYRHYGETDNILLEKHGNYGSMTGLTLNVGAYVYPTAQGMYFITKNSATGTIKIGYKASISGTTTDPRIGNGKYAGFVTSGTTGSTVMLTGTIPTSGTLYPLVYMLFFALRGVPVTKNEYYVAEGDVMLDMQVTGNTAASYIGLVPIYTGLTVTPDRMVTDFDMQEGCLGAGKYDRYNWVHMKTRFMPTENSVNIVLAAKNINYTRAGKITIRNFTVKKETVDIEFITPPPLPHACYFDIHGQNETLFTHILSGETFNSTYWQTGGTLNIGCRTTLSSSPTGDLAQSVFRSAYNSGKGAGQVKTTLYAHTPSTANLYYYSFDLNVTYAGGTLTYDQMPVVTFYPFLSSIAAIGTMPPALFFKGSYVNGTTRYEGFVLPTTGTGAPHPVTDASQNGLSDEDTSSSTPAMPVPPDWTTIFMFNNYTSLASDYTIKLTNLFFKQVNLFYLDDDEQGWWYKQPHAFGYSKNTNVTAPDYAIGGGTGAWIIPYIPTGTTTSGGDVAGWYESYHPVANVGDTSPLMQVNRAYVDKFDADVTDSVIDINLTQSCGLAYKFYEDNGLYPAACITPDGVTIQDQLFMSASMNLTFDGFYPTTGSTYAGLGPFYTPKSTYGIYATYGDTNTACAKNTHTRVPLINDWGANWEELRADTGYTQTHLRIPKDFNTELTTVSLANRTGNRYLIVNRYNLIKVDASLIYDSTTDKEQVVHVKLMGANGFVYHEHAYTVGGSANPSYAPLAARTLNFTFDGFYYINDEIYLTVYPDSFDCTIKATEDIDFTGAYTLSGSTTSKYTTLTAGGILDENTQTHNWTYFTGNTYQYMFNGVYDTIRFTPTGVVNPASPPPSTVYDNEYEFYMAFVSGATSTGKTIMLMNKAVDTSQYTHKNAFMEGIRNQLPAPFTGVTWTGYSANGIATSHTENALSGTTYTVRRKSYAKIYESNVSGIDADLERNLIAFYKKNGRLTYKNGYSKLFFDDPIDRFYTASDATAREVFAYGSSAISVEPDGIHLKYNFAKDLAGYPITGEFLGRVTASDTCGNFATIYILLCMNVKDNAVITRIGSPSSVYQVEINAVT